MPVFRALKRTAARPSAGRGPVDFCALARLASICCRVAIDLMGDAEEVWKAGKARKGTDLSAPTFTVVDGLGGAGWGWGIRVLESWKHWCENGVTGFWGWCRGLGSGRGGTRRNCWGVGLFHGWGHARSHLPERRI